MLLSVNPGNLDALLGVTFGPAGFANLTATLVDGTVTNTPTSPSEIITYNGTTATVGSAFFPAMTTLSVASVDDTGNALTVDAFVGGNLVGMMNFSVVGFSAQGIALAAMPLDALISQAGNLPGLSGSLFELGFNAAGGQGSSVDFTATGTYNFLANASVHYATVASPVLQGDTGAQMLIGLSGNDTITAGPGETLIYGGPGANLLIGGAGTDTIIGTTGNDTMIGGSGTTVLQAGAGTSVLYAEAGQAVLIAGAGTDTFIFTPGHTGGATAATADVIQNFQAALGDTVNLTAFAATLPAGIGHLTFIGTAAFDGHAGEVRYDVTASGVTVSGDIDGNRTADFVITMTGLASLNAHAFIL